MSDSIDTSGKALVDFWKRAGDKGEMNSNTATSFRAACTAVLGVLDDWQNVDVRTLDVDDVFRRFVNKNSTKFKQGSLQAYGRRWPLAVKSFMDYANNPTTWRAPAADKPMTVRKEKKSNGTEAAAEQPSLDLGARPSGPTLPGTVEYPFPLREGRLAYLRLPVDLKMAEVKRLTAYLNTLAIDNDAV